MYEMESNAMEFGTFPEVTFYNDEETLGLSLG
jgi:hypothetical protein